MREDKLDPKDSEWIAKNERLWRRAHELARLYPNTDVSDFYHTLVQLERSPLERLERSLQMARLGKTD